MGQFWAIFVYFRLFYLTQFKYKWIKTLIGCLRLKPGAAGWKAQPNPLSHGGTPFRQDFEKGLLLNYIALFSRGSRGRFKDVSSWVLLKGGLFDVPVEELTNCKKWAIPTLFFLHFRLLNTGDSKLMFLIIKGCPFLVSNTGPRLSEATALPTEPQPLE